MFVITVVPLKRGITIDTLTYFSHIPYTPGVMVRVPVRETEILGLVTEAQPVSTAKTALRAATFSLKKLPHQEVVATLSDAYIKTAQKLSSYYAASLGAILYSLLPPEIQAGDIQLPHTRHFESKVQHVPEVFQAMRTERHRAYKSLVRETFAHSGSVLCVAPSSAEADILKNVLSHGIEDRVITLTTAATKSELKKAYAELEDFSKTKLIIVTPSHAMIERHDITLTIVEHARSSYYQELTRPHLDTRIVLQTHASYTGRRILFGDLVPRTEEELKRRNDVYLTFGETPKRLELPGKIEIINLAPKPGVEAAFSIFSDEAIEQMKDARKRKGRVFLLAARRGLAPIVICLDCGFIFRSKESGAPYSLIRTYKNGVEERWFVCGASGERVRAHETCTECGSWRLKERGIGVQQVHDELHKIFPQTPIILFDHITARTYKKATFLRDTFYETKGSILLGTQMAIPYLHTPITTSIVVNMDALRTIPTWRLEEENLALLLALREISLEKVLVQTRTQNEELLTYAKQGTIETFYSDELLLRKNFNYPPNCTFVHLTWQGNLKIVQEIKALITTVFESYTPLLYEHPTASSDNPIYYALMRIPEWPNATLVEKLRTLPPSVRIMINPDKIV